MAGAFLIEIVPIDRGFTGRIVRTGKRTRPPILLGATDTKRLLRLCDVLEVGLGGGAKGAGRRWPLIAQILERDGRVTPLKLATEARCSRTCAQSNLRRAMRRGWLVSERHGVYMRPELGEA